MEKEKNSTWSSTFFAFYFFILYSFTYSIYDFFHNKIFSSNFTTHNFDVLTKKIQ